MNWEEIEDNQDIDDEDSNLEDVAVENQNLVDKLDNQKVEVDWKNLPSFRLDSSTIVLKNVQECEPANAPFSKARRGRHSVI